MDASTILGAVELLTQAIGAIDPAVGATVQEIAALEAVASKVLTLVSQQKGVDIETVVAGLTYENPNPDQD